MAIATISRKSRNTLGFPYTLRLADGRTVAVEVPIEMVVKDRGGDTAFTPAGVRFIDRVRALFMPIPTNLTPGFIRTLRDALHLTQQQLGEAVGVDKMTVFRWEKGILRPSSDSANAIKRLRDKAVRRGVEIT